MLKTNKTKLLAIAAAAAVAMSALPASATFINGSISFSDGFSSTGTTTSIVSQLTTISVQASANDSGACNGDFSGCSPTTSSFAFNIPSPGGVTIFTIDGFTFALDSVFNIVRTPLSCFFNLCTDDLAFNGAGIVSKTGFQDTAFMMAWTGNGSCNGSGTSCTAAPTASWSDSLTALGRADVPEPSGIAWLGMGLVLAGFGWTRRRSRRG